jgi:hypothetical protein
MRTNGFIGAQKIEFNAHESDYVVRRKTATQLLAALMTNKDFIMSEGGKAQAIEMAVVYADSLIERLNKH